MRSDEHSSIALIGYGAIADEIVLTLERLDELQCLRGILVRPDALSRSQTKSRGSFPIVTDVSALLALQADVVIEAAGHAAARHFGLSLLTHDSAVLFSSVGVFADRTFASQAVACTAARSKLLVAPGAVAGIDGLRASRTAGLSSVCYTSWKPPHAWRDTSGDELVDRLEGRSGVFFEGTARQAALDYPRNANVGALIGLMGLGLDRTTVRLGADATLHGPKGVIEAEGDFGTFRFEIGTRASANPKTSAITAHSLLAAIREGTAIDALEAVKDSLD
jgi:aspartate dehydrogenase